MRRRADVFSGLQCCSSGESKKEARLLNILQEHASAKTLIFVNTKKGADEMFMMWPHSLGTVS